MSSDDSRRGARRRDECVAGDRADRGRSARSLTFYTIAVVAEMLDVSIRTVRRWIAGGELTVHRFGGAVRIAETDFKVFVALRRQEKARE
jgi:excisionase family DNA binding protein